MPPTVVSVCKTGVSEPNVSLKSRKVTPSSNVRKPTALFLPITPVYFSAVSTSITFPLKYSIIFEPLFTTFISAPAVTSTTPYQEITSHVSTLTNVSS